MIQIELEEQKDMLYNAGFILGSTNKRGLYYTVFQWLDDEHGKNEWVFTRFLTDDEFSELVEELKNEIGE